MSETEHTELPSLDVERQPDDPEAGLVDTALASAPSDDELQSLYPGDPPLPEGRGAEASGLP